MPLLTTAIPTAEQPARTGRSQPPAFQPGSLRPAARAELAKRMTSTGQETSR